MAKMISFKDVENNVILGRILLDDDNIICGCCGGIIESDDPQFEIIEKLEWLDISEEILGE